MNLPAHDMGIRAVPREDDMISLVPDTISQNIPESTSTAIHTQAQNRSFDVDKYLKRNSLEVGEDTPPMFDPDIAFKSDLSKIKISINDSNKNYLFELKGKRKFDYETLKILNKEQYIKKIRV